MFPSKLEKKSHILQISKYTDNAQIKQVITNKYEIIILILHIKSNETK